MNGRSIERKTALNIAEVFFESLTALRGLVWCAHIMANWEQLDGLLSRLEATVLSAYVETEQLQARLDALAKLRSSLGEKPQSQNNWALVASCARHCLEALGDDCEGLPIAGEDEEPRVPIK